MQYLLLKNKLNFKIASLVATILVMVSAMGIFSQTKFASAACSPTATKISGSPLTISKAKPTLTVDIVITGVDSCTPAAMDNMEAYVLLSGTTHKVATWSVSTYVGSDPGKSEYTLESTINIFAQVPGTDSWKTIFLTPGVSVGSTDKNNTTAKIQVNNTSGTNNNGGTPLPPTNTNTNTNTGTNTNTPPINPNTNTNTPTTPQVTIPAITNPFGTANTIPGLANRVINVLLALIVIAAVIVIIVAGLRMVTSGSDPAQLKKSKTAIVWAIVGLIVALMSFAIVAIVQSLL